MDTIWILWGVTVLVRVGFGDGVEGVDCCWFSNVVGGVLARYGHCEVFHIRVSGVMWMLLHS